MLGGATDRVRLTKRLDEREFVRCVWTDRNDMTYLRLSGHGVGADIVADLRTGV